MSSLGYVDLLSLLAQVEAVGRTQTLRVVLEGGAGPPAAPTGTAATAGAEGSHAAGAEGADPAPSLFDAIRTQDRLYEETQRLRNRLLGLLAEMQRAARPGAPAPAAAPATPTADAAGDEPRPWTEEEIVELLDAAQLALIQHPVAAQAAFSALVREGRRYAATAEGGRWLELLGSSPFVRRARWIWETTSLNMLEEDAGTIVPSTYLEALLRAAEMPDMEQLLGRVKGMGHDRE